MPARPRSIPTLCAIAALLAAAGSVAHAQPIAAPLIEGRVGSRVVVASSSPASPPSSARSLIDETTDFATAVKHVERYVAAHGADRVLLVVDIDNTLLAMTGPLGSDQWFEWQDYLLEHEPTSPHLVAKDFAGLLAAQGRLFALGRMHPPQENEPALVEQVQSMGVRTLVLTSRGPEFRSPTERELRRNGYDFARTAVRAKRAPRGAFKPYNQKDFSKSGLTDEEAGLFRLGTPRDVSYANGVFMTSGQHKGAMLLILLAKARAEFDAVVFVDDHGRHVARVYDALRRRGVDIAAVHYKREDANVDRFNYGDKTRVDQQWRRLDKAVRAAFE